MGGGAGDRRQTRVGGEGGQGVVHLAVDGQGAVGELHGDVLPAEPLDQAAQRRCRSRAAAAVQRLADRALAAPGEHEHLPGRVGDDRVEVVDGTPLLLAGELGGADRAAQPLVTGRAAGEQEQVAALGIGHPVLRGGEPQRQLRAEDRAHAQLGGGLGEADHAVHPVVVGERQGLEPEPGSLLDQLLGVARPVQEAEVGVAVQLAYGTRGPAAATISGGGR